ncbi:MAG: hypothetical protein RRY26_11105 [Cellulosilyticaceae bacterium]
MKYSIIKGLKKSKVKSEKNLKKGVDLCRLIVHNKSSSSETAANKNKAKALMNKEK